MLNERTFEHNIISYGVDARAGQFAPHFYSNFFNFLFLCFVFLFSCLYVGMYYNMCYKCCPNTTDTTYIMINVRPFHGAHYCFSSSHARCNAYKREHVNFKTFFPEKSTIHTYAYSFRCVHIDDGG